MELNSAIVKFERLITLVIVLVLAIICRLYVFNIAIVPTGSMDPTIKPYDAVIVLRFMYYFKPIERQDIVVFKSNESIDSNRSENERKTPLVKRVIGLEGDRVKLIRGNLYVNDQLVIEDYVANKGIDTTEEFLVPNDSVFLLGDNRPVSYDSRYWDNHFIKEKDIIGRAWLHVGLLK